MLGPLAVNADGGGAVEVAGARLRTLLIAPVESYPTGYRLALEPDVVDAARFERDVAVPRSPASRSSGSRRSRTGSRPISGWVVAPSSRLS